MNKIGNAYVWPLLLGVILIIAGLIISIPGGALTTRSSLNGEKTDYYVFDNKYSSIDEYVGGDAYNFIIGASLVAGKMAGAIAAKAICMVGGLLSVCAGMVLMTVSKNEDNAITVNTNSSTYITASSNTSTTTTKPKEISAEQAKEPDTQSVDAPPVESKVQNSTAATELVKPIIMVDSNVVVCPLCNRKQLTGRKSCYNCGAIFVSD